MKPSWQPVVGLEIHVELKTQSKMFCGCSVKYFGKEPNTHTCPVCLGLPGALPVPNRKAIEWTILTGLALDCEIPLVSKFDRKNYFYPDLPKGYQISQYDMPLAQNGKWKMENGKLVRIRRVHLEEDTAKLIHQKKFKGLKPACQQDKIQGSKGETGTLVDFNRSGVPLMEIVSEPDFCSLEEVRAYTQKIRQILRYLDVSDCDMEKGQMRFELNVSLRKKGEKLPAYKVEVKNINSFRFLERALKDEIKRQANLLAKGKTPIQETRGFDETQGVTVSQRWKEEAQDYRYFPEPDIPPIHWAKKEIEKLKDSLPELPDQKMARFQKEYGLTEYQTRILTRTKAKADYFEEAVKVGKEHKLEPKKIATVIINKRVDTEKYLPAELIEILVKKKAKPKLPEAELKKIVNQIIKKNPKAVKDYKQGKTNAIMFLIGQVQRKSQGQADPQVTKKLLSEKLESRK